MKHTKPFRFTHYLKKKVVRDLKIVTESLELEISGTGYMNTSVSTLEPYERWTADIDYIVYQGKDIREVVEFFGQLEEIETAAVREVANLFTEKMSA